jgi:hypothetical protein
MPSYSGKWYLQIGGVSVRIDKRGNPYHCALCRRDNVRLHYHHWDNLYPDKGLWLCSYCHRIAEVLDLIEKRRWIWDEYFRLKYKVNNEPERNYPIWIYNQIEEAAEKDRMKKQKSGLPLSMINWKLG